MSATIYFNTATHVWCCDEHDVLGKKVRHPDQCFGCFLGQKEGVFWEKNVFLVESLIFF